MDIKRISEQEVSDIIQKEDIDLSSFEVQSTLNPKIFDKEQHMHEDVRRRLLMIADDFFETLNVGWVDIDDIILTGSLANFNWSKFSDVDLHILVNFSDVDENEELVKEYFNSKKNLWNEKHDITIKGYDVELYMQDTEEPHVSSGVYSIMWDGWVVKPDITKKEIDSKKVGQKVNNIIDAIHDIYYMYKHEDYDKTIRMIKNLKEKIYFKSNNRKVVLIFNSEALSHGSAESANMLLKILEEPPKNTTFILVTDLIDQVTPTIKSRCQTIYVPRLTSEVISSIFSSNKSFSTDFISFITDNNLNTIDSLMLWNESKVLECIKNYMNAIRYKNADSISNFTNSTLLN